MCWTKKEKEPPGICGVADMQGTICGGDGRWMLPLLVALIFTFTHFDTVIMDFPVNVMEKKHPFAFPSSYFGFETVDGHIGAEMKYFFRYPHLFK